MRGTGQRRGTAPSWTAAGRVTGAMTVAVLAVVAVGGWSVVSTVTARPVLENVMFVPGGAVHVDAVYSAGRPRHRMPGMGMDNDPVPADKRRVSLDVTLVADDGDEALDYTVRGFALALDGEPPLRPHKSVLPGTSVPPGTQLAGTLVYDVPRDARAGELRFAGTGTGAAAVVLPPEGDSVGGHGGGGAHH